MRDAIGTLDLDLVLVHSADNVYYLSGLPLLDEWGRPMWVLLNKSGDATIVGAMIEKENMANHTWIKDVRVYEDLAQSLDAATEIAIDFALASGRPPARIGIERSVMSLRLWDAVRAAFPEADFVDVGDALSEARIIKSGEEFELLRLGAQVAKIGANAFLNALKEGVTELHVAAAATAAMDDAMGALDSGSGTSTYTYCQVGSNTLTPHLHPTGRRVRRGDLIALNVFPVIWGYCVELERTLVFGQPSDLQAQAMEAVNEAFEAIKVGFVPGARFADLDRRAREMLSSRGFGANLRHGTGHAHGIMIGSTAREELGEIRLYNEGVVRVGMANSVEPGIYLDDLGGFRHSDVVLVYESGSMTVTDFPRDIVMH